MIKSVLFVCLGNICRSPLAHGIAREVFDDVVVDSAGTGSWHIGEPPCVNSIKVAKKHGIDISDLRARQVRKEDFKRFDLIVALDRQNKKDLLRLGAKNVRLLGEFGYNGEDVPDPYYFNDFEGFEMVFKMIKKCVENLADEYSK